MQDTIIKTLLVLLGALAGALVTRYTMRRRIRSLMPLALFQLERAAGVCKAVFSCAEADAARAALELARQFATEVLVAEIDRKQWLEGAQLLEQARIAMDRVKAEGDRAAVQTTQDLRDAAHSLQRWASVVRQDYPLVVGMTNGERSNAAS